jgi:glycosyltransferase involved in cell wall biosynthesis
MPALNEAENLKILAPRLPRDDSFEYILISDGSTDNTAQIAREFLIPCITVERTLGRDLAIDLGVQTAAKPYHENLIFFDSDGQHDPSCLTQLPRMLDAYMLVKGSRFDQTSPQHSTPIDRLWLANFLSFFLRQVTGLNVADPNCGLIAIRKVSYYGLRTSITIDRHLTIALLIALGSEDGNTG